MSVWVVGGNDPSGGAGLAADVRTLQSFGVHAKPVVTAVTAQSQSEGASAGVVSAETLAAQLSAIARDGAPRAVKIGMLGSAANVRVVAKALAGLNAPVVLDPVLASSSGMALADAETIDGLKRELLPLVTLVTPNVPEASALTGSYDVAECARRLLEMGAQSVLVKGGHEGAIDRELVHDHAFVGTRTFKVTGASIAKEARGTGCAYASAVAAHLSASAPQRVSDDDLNDSLIVARAYVTRALRTSSSGLLNHTSWPPEGQDFPWVGPRLPAFPAPTRLGFYPIVDRATWIERLAAAGARTLQIRVKDLAGPDLERELRLAVASATSHGASLYVNDHWELALALGAHGVHLGQEDLETADLRALRAADIRLGVSTHCYFEAAVAKAVAPSYAALGPIKPTTCKSMRFGPRGFARIAEWRALLGLPLVAIGGLTLDDVAAAMHHGADGVAVISDVVRASNPEARAHAWLEATGERS